MCDGKSTVLGYAHAMGAGTVSADAIVGDLYNDPQVQERLADEFGAIVLDCSGVNRSVLRQIALGNEAARQKLNRLVHPLVMERMLATATGAPGLWLLEIPLLIEACLQGLFEHVWVVSAGRAEQTRRLVERLDGDEHLAAEILATQIPTEAKEAFATAIVRTNHPPLVVKNDVEHLIRGLPWMG